MEDIEHRKAGRHQEQNAVARNDSKNRSVEFMGDKSRTIRRLAAGCTAIVLAGAAAFSVDAQNGPSAGRRAIEAGRRAAEARKAIYTLIETYFAPLGNVVKGSTRYDEADVQKRVVRVAFLAIS